MKFSELLHQAISRSEIPLRFEPGAEEAVARPIVELLRAWIQSHLPEAPGDAFDHGREAALTRLLEELDDRAEIAAG
jgi:hypothetical protein